MTTALAAAISIALAGTYSNTIKVGTVKHDIKFNPNYSFTDGTGANQAKSAFVDTRTLAASATENLDMVAGGLTDAFGNVISFSKIKAIIIQADPGNTNNVLFGGAASNAAAPWFGDISDIVVIRPGGCVALIAPDANGYAITATTADLIKMANSGAGTSVNYTIVVIGV